MMGRKIKSCEKCWFAVNWEAWHTLELVAVDKSDGAETRLCGRCGVPMICDVRHLATLELRTEAERHLIAARIILRWRLKRAAKRIGLALAAVAAVAGLFVAFW